MLPAISLIVMAETIIPHTHAARQAQEFGIISRAMPQNKLTSRIAAITGKLAVALAVLLAPAILIAETISVTFDAALTNETGWVYDTGFEYVSTQKKYGFKSGNNNLDQIISPVFDFAVTSVVINAEKASNKTTRKMSIRATSGNAAHNAVELVDGIIPPDQVSFTITNIWDKSDGVHSFSLLTTGGNGHLYLTGAVISGVPIIDAPTNLQADNIRGTRCGLSWTNPANAVSNRVDVLEVTRIAGSSSVERKYDFNEFSNDGTTSQQTESIVSAYPDLSGYMLCLPTNTTGQIQLSTRDDKGVLIIREFESYEGLRLELITRHYDHLDEAKTMSIGYVLDGATNDFASVELASEFSTSSIPLSEVPAGAPLILNNSGKKKYHRVIIDEISFVRNFAVSTNLVKTAFVTNSTTYSVRGLCPRTEYVARITAFDAAGNESSPSEPLAVTTNGEALPFSIRIQ